MKKYTWNLLLLSLSLIVLMGGNSAFAQENVVVASAAKPVVKDDVIITAGDKAEKEAREKAAEEEDEPTFTFSGSVDTYFHSSFKTQNAYYGDAYAPSTSFADMKGFGLGMVNLIASYGGDKVGFTGDVVFGPRGKAAVFGTASGQGIINQAFVYYKFSDKAVSYTHLDVYKRQANNWEK